MNKAEKVETISTKKADKKSGKPGFWSDILQKLQTLGKSLMFPIAVLPFAALLNRFGSLAMELNPVVGGVKNAGYWIGFILQKPGAVVFDNIALLFAIGTAFGLSKDNRGEAALVGAVLFFALTAFLTEGGLAELLYKNVLTFTTYRDVNVTMNVDDVNALHAAGAAGWDAWLTGHNYANLAGTNWETFDSWFKANQGSLPKTGVIDFIYSTKAGKFSELFYVKGFGRVSEFGAAASAINDSGLANTGGTYILDIGVLGGIVAGCMSAWLYNKFSGIKLPMALSFFGGRRFVPMMVMIISWPLAFLFAVIWPWFQFGLVKFGQLLSSGDAWAVPGAFLYALLNRIIQPFGLHHIINTFLWFQLPIEGHMTSSFSGKIILDPGLSGMTDFIKNGEIVVNDAFIGWLNEITKGWKNIPEITADNWTDYFTYASEKMSASNGTIISGQNAQAIVFGDINAFQRGVVSGNFQTGFFPMYWGGLTAASGAMILAAPKENRKSTATFLGGIAAVAALTGIDEPIVFSFIFVGPVLWGYNAVFTAIFAAIGVAMHMHIGFGFSGGLIDYFISFAQSWGMSKYEGWVNGSIYGILSNPLWMLVLAAAIAPLYFFSFYFTIKKMDIQTPGRESTGGSNVPTTKSTATPSKDGKKATKNDKYDAMATQILEIVGIDNIVKVDNCASRLRLTVKDNSVGEDAQFKALGAYGVKRLGNEGLQIVIGTDVEHVAQIVRDKTGK